MAAEPVSLQPFRAAKRLKGDASTTEIVPLSTPAATTRPAQFHRKALIRIKLEVDSDNEPGEEMAPTLFTSGAMNTASSAQSASAKHEMASMDHMPLAKMKHEPVNEEKSGCGAQPAIKSEEKFTDDPGRQRPRRRFLTKAALPVCIEIDATVKREQLQPGLGAAYRDFGLSGT